MVKESKILNKWIRLLQKLNNKRRVLKILKTINYRQREFFSRGKYIYRKGLPFFFDNKTLLFIPLTFSTFSYLILSLLFLPPLSLLIISPYNLALNINNLIDLDNIKRGIIFQGKVL